jgi:hypothetical protein
VLPASVTAPGSTAPEPPEMIMRRARPERYSHSAWVSRSAPCPKYTRSCGDLPPLVMPVSSTTALAGATVPSGTGGFSQAKRASLTSALLVPSSTSRPAACSQRRWARPPGLATKAPSSRATSHTAGSSTKSRVLERRKNKRIARQTDIKTVMLRLLQHLSGSK